jgi:hypothetical protein
MCEVTLSVEYIVTVCLFTPAAWIFRDSLCSYFNSDYHFLLKYSFTVPKSKHKVIFVKVVFYM